MTPSALDTFEALVAAALAGDAAAALGLPGAADAMLKASRASHPIVANAMDMRARLVAPETRYGESRTMGADEEAAADIAHLRDMLGGEGDLLNDKEIRDAWQGFSTSFDAAWLTPSPLMLGNFASWLIRRSLPEA